MNRRNRAPRHGDAWRGGLALSVVLTLSGCAGPGFAPVESRTGPVAPAPTVSRPPPVTEPVVVHTAPVRAGATDARGIEVRPLEAPIASAVSSSTAPSAAPTAVSVRTMPRGLKVPYSDAVWNEMKAVDRAAMAAVASGSKVKMTESRLATELEGKAKSAAKPEEKPDARTEMKPSEEARSELKIEAARDDKGDKSVKADVKSETQSEAVVEGGRDWGWPASGRVTQTFDGAASKGLMISGKTGEPVLAAADGQVIFSGAGPRGYGNLVIVKHPKDLVSVYAQNRTLLVKEGQQVKRGQKLAELGEAASSGPRLQFEIRERGKPVDPSRFLPRR
jgi:lipoprotein NlpD